MIGAVRDALGVLRMPCREHTTLFTRQLDEPLRPGIAAGLRLHVLYCSGCRRFRAQVRLLHELAAHVGREVENGEPMPDSVRDRVMRRVDADRGNL